MQQSIQRPNLFFQFIKDFFKVKSDNPVVPVTLIWHHVKTGKGWQHHLCEGDSVLVVGNKLCNCHDKPNCIITSLRQRINGNDSEISVMDLKTRQLSIVKL